MVSPIVVLLCGLRVARHKVGVVTVVTRNRGNSIAGICSTVVAKLNKLLDADAPFIGTILIRQKREWTLEFTAARLLQLEILRRGVLL